MITPRPELGLIYYVADSEGDDENGNGTLENPFKTLEKARDRIRELKNGEGLPEGGVMVYLREGKYKRIDSFELGIQDSGTAESPITYAAYPGEQVSITGGHLLANSHFSEVVDPAILNRLPEEAHGKVYQYDLGQDGITEYGMIERSGFQWTRKPPAVELFFNDQAMTLARYPNDGYVRVLSVVQPGSAALFGHTTDDGAIFTYQGDRPSRWREASDIWVDGFWWIDYASSTLKVDQIDTIKKEITGAHATGYPVTAGDRYFYYNLLEEIDMPGEWYLDRDTGILYVYPPGELEGSNIQLSAMEDTMIIMNQVSHVQLVGLTIEGTRGAGIQIKGGTSVFIDGCEIARLGMDAISVDGGSNHGIEAIYI